MDLAVSGLWQVGVCGVQNGAEVEVMGSVGISPQRGGGIEVKPPQLGMFHCCLILDVD
jgi:hypothetical protein